MGLPKAAIKTYRTKLPVSKTEVEFRPYLVKEEKALLIASQEEDETAMLVASINLINSCVLTEGIQAEHLYDPDLQWLLIHIRAKSVGEDVHFMQKCGSCGMEFETRFNIENIKCVFEDGYTPEYEADVGEEKFIIEFSLPTSTIVVQASQEQNQILQISKMMESCIQKVTHGGNVLVRGVDFTEQDIPEFFDQLTGYHFENIYKKVFEMGPKIKHVFKSKCPHCGHEETYEVEGLTNFFG